MNALELNHLGKTYNGNQEALKDVSMTIGKGEIFGFLGPNGSGKTTTVRLLNGILAPTCGTAKVLGIDIASGSSELHRHCGVMTETAQLYDNLTGMENLKFFGGMHGMKPEEIRQKGGKLLESLELADSSDKKVKAYSTGMKRRLSLARALLHSPEILFLDEPTSGLDPESALNVTRLIRQLSIEHGVTVFLCTHQLKYAQEICSLYGFIHKGSILGFGTLEELLKQKNGRKYLEIRGDSLPAIPDLTPLQDGRYRIPITSDRAAFEILSEIFAKGGRVYEANHSQWDLEDLYFHFQKEAQQ